METVKIALKKFKARKRVRGEKEGHTLFRQ